MEGECFRCKNLGYDPICATQDLITCNKCGLPACKVCWEIDKQCPYSIEYKCGVGGDV